jgi:hypothetical protein
MIGNASTLDSLHLTWMEWANYGPNRTMTTATTTQTAVRVAKTSPRVASQPGDEQTAVQDCLDLISQSTGEIRAIERPPLTGRSKHYRRAFETLFDRLLSLERTLRSQMRRKFQWQEPSNVSTHITSLQEHCRRVMDENERLRRRHGDAAAERPDLAAALAGILYRQQQPHSTTPVRGRDDEFHGRFWLAADAIIQELAAQGVIADEKKSA